VGGAGGPAGGVGYRIDRSGAAWGVVGRASGGNFLLFLCCFFALAWIRDLFLPVLCFEP